MPTTGLEDGERVSSRGGERAQCVQEPDSDDTENTVMTLLLFLYYSSTADTSGFYLKIVDEF